MHHLFTRRRAIGLAVAGISMLATSVAMAATTVTVWTDLTDPGVPDSTRPGVAKVPLSDIVGEAVSDSA